jgi:hypothetical protein
MFKHLIAVFFFFCISNLLIAQNDFASLSLSSYNKDKLNLYDSIPKKKHKYINPRASMYKSLILPGLGQAANRQYWKIPVLYAGFAVCVYSINFANTYYQDFKQAYIWRLDGDSTTIDKYDPLNLTSNELKYTPTQLKYARDYYRRNLELSVIVTAGVYLLNVIDAYVSAHLLNFDVTDDLSIQFSVPVIYNYRNANILMNGVTLRF